MATPDGIGVAAAPTAIETSCAAVPSSGRWFRFIQDASQKTSVRRACRPAAGMPSAGRSSRAAAGRSSDAASVSRGRPTTAARHLRQTALASATSPGSG